MLLIRKFAISFALFSSLTFAIPAAGESPKSSVSILDAQTLNLAGEKLRLVYIHAPNPADVCPYKNRTMACGRIATTALMDLTAGAKVVCRKQGRDKKNRQLARCWAGGYDLSEGMVYTGWARAAKSAPAIYHKVEQDAKTRRRGLWQGAFPGSVEKALAEKSN